MRVKINTKKKKIVFITGTRADFGKIKSLIEVLCREKKFEVHVFATGMHMSSRYGMTVQEIYKCGFKNIFEYRNGVHKGKHAPHVLSSTISGFDKYIKKLKPDLIVVHGDRVEALAGALVGSLNNILVGHVEGGEVSGTIDDHIRHSLSKLSNLHFVANEKARKRLIQMGESESDIFVIGSPDLDIMLSDNLPTIEEVKEHYEIPYDKYAVVLYHPVFTEYHLIKEQTKILVDALILSKSNYVVIYPNNDLGSEIILDIYKKKLSNQENFRIFSSIRFEKFLTLLKHANHLIGNSSAGLREAPFYGVPSIDIGTRQRGRLDGNKSPSVHHADYNTEKLVALIRKFFDNDIKYKSKKHFGDGKSRDRFLSICSRENGFWKTTIQKQFIDLD